MWATCLLTGWLIKRCQKVEDSKECSKCMDNAHNRKQYSMLPKQASQLPIGLLQLLIHCRHDTAILWGGGKWQLIFSWPHLNPHCLPDCVWVFNCVPTFLTSTSDKHKTLWVTFLSVQCKTEGSSIASFSKSKQYADKCISAFHYLQFCILAVSVQQGYPPLTF